MFSKFILSTALAASAMTAVPAAAQAQGYGYYGRDRYESRYRNDYQAQRPALRRAALRRPNYSHNYGRHCSGTTGTILGAALGALLGRQIDGGRSRTTGLIVGGAAGALGRPRRSTRISAGTGTGSSGHTWLLLSHRFCRKPKLLFGAMLETLGLRIEGRAGHQQ
jgi:hypothetical protein